MYLLAVPLASSEPLYDQVRRRWILSTVLSAAVAAPLLVAFPGTSEPAHLSVRAWIVLGGMAVSSWFGVLGILGAGAAYLRSLRAPFLARANEGVLPFYVLHQSVILAIGWQLLPLGLPDLATWALVFIASLLVTVAACEWLVRPFAPMRFLFGMSTRTPTRP